MYSLIVQFVSRWLKQHITLSSIHLDKIWPWELDLVWPLKVTLSLDSSNENAPRCVWGSDVDTAGASIVDKVSVETDSPSYIHARHDADCNINTVRIKQVTFWNVVSNACPVSWHLLIDHNSFTASSHMVTEIKNITISKCTYPIKTFRSDHAKCEQTLYYLGLSLRPMIIFATLPEFCQKSA